MVLEPMRDMQPWEWMQDLDVEQFPEPYQTMAREVGVPNMLKLARHFAGTGMYFPKLDDKLMAMRNERIRAEFDGSNHKELARRYDLTERWVYEILKLEENKDQIALF